jgi:hypothetical protein
MSLARGIVMTASGQIESTKTSWVMRPEVQKRRARASISNPEAVSAVDWYYWSEHNAVYQTIDRDARFRLLPTGEVFPCGAI